MFLQGLTGILMRVEEDEITRYRFEVWFDYTRGAINTIGEGTMIVVPNFASSDKNGFHYSVLEVTGLLPMHYALGSDVSGYPGFVAEAARNAGLDWLSQETTSTEETTKIRCMAIPTNLEIVEPDLTIERELNLPMVGHPVNVLDTEMTERVANLNLDLEHDSLIQIGNLVRDSEVRAWLEIEGLLKVHFGIFGFTGAGKSNLLSTLVSKLLSQQENQEQPVKIVIFDLMGEYTGLLIDQLYLSSNSYIVNLGVETLPESILDYYRAKAGGSTNGGELRTMLEKATLDLSKSLILPKALKQSQDGLHYPLAILLHQNRVVFLSEKHETAGSVIANFEFSGNMGNCATEVYKFRRELQKEFADSEIDQSLLDQLEKRIENFKNYLGKTITQTAIKNLDTLYGQFEGIAAQPRAEIPANAQISLGKLISILNNDENALLIVQSADPDRLREFVGVMSNVAYDVRRREGRITPLASFIFDEADEYLPQQANDSQKRSKAAITTLARRGRKFGLGIGIATQRIRYLDTSILAQPHTYFISKLPRKADRDAVMEAFGMSEDMFRQTFKFRKGDWLLASYDAAGLEAIPIPVHLENAEERLLRFLREIAEKRGED